MGVVAACMPAMQPLLNPILKRFGTERTGVSKRSGNGHKSPWAARLRENDARNALSTPAPARFHRLDDTERPPTNAHSSSMSDAIYVGAEESSTTNDSFYRQDSGRIDQDAVPLNAIHVKKDVSISGAQQFQNGPGI